MVHSTDPMALDVTALALVNEMDRENALLAAYLEQRRGEVFGDMAGFSRIIRGNSVAQNRKMFPEGDRIYIQWKDMDDPNHNTNETAYIVPLNIVHHAMVYLQSGRHVPGCFLQWHYATPYGIQYSHSQAFRKCPNGLAAGVYSITFGDTFGNAGAQEESVWHFTLRQPVPSGGQLSGFEAMGNAAPSTWRVKSWASPSAVTPIETVTVAAGAQGTSLGTMGLMRPLPSSADLNCMQRVSNGSSRWDASAVRKYLNGTGTGWWTPTDEFDVRPDQYAKHGFLDGFDSEFLDQIKPVMVTTALNAAEGYADSAISTFDRFFVPSIQQMFITPYLSMAANEPFKYWQGRHGRATIAPLNGLYPNLITTGIEQTSTAQIVQLRSPYPSSAHQASILNVTGGVVASSVNAARRLAPVCVVC